MTDELRDKIGLEPTAKVGTVAMSYEKYKIYANNRIALLKAEMKKNSSEKSCVKRKYLLKMILNYQNRLERKRRKFKSSIDIQAYEDIIKATLEFVN